MEIRLLRYFSAVAEARSFTRAAQTLGISQPTLSHQIRKLESDLGTILFERAVRNVTLTSAGSTFKPFCERTLKEPEFAARQFLDRFFASRNLQPKIAFEMNAVDPILAVVRDSDLAYSRLRRRRWQRASRARRAPRRSGAAPCARGIVAPWRSCEENRWHS